MKLCHTELRQKVEAPPSQVCITLFSDGVDGILWELLSLSNVGDVHLEIVIKNLFLSLKGRLQLQPPNFPRV